MAQKKKVSVSSVASNKAKEVQKTAATRAKSTVTKKTVSKAPTKAKSAQAAKTAAPKTTTGKTAAAKTTATRKAAAKPAAASTAKPAGSKTVKKTEAAPVKAKAAQKAQANTRAKIAAAAKKVAARKSVTVPAANVAAPVKAKAVAAASSATAKRSSEPVGTEAAAAEGAKKAGGVKHGFKLNEYVVYPAHGVGEIVAIEEQEIAGMSLELFVITFEKDKMTLRVPTSKVDSMRKLSETGVVDKSMTTLKGRARVKRTMWSRRAQEYENKINSGDLIAIAEVVRDLYRSESQPEQSYSERQLYEAALDRMARELAAVEKIDERQATQRIVDVLSKSAKGRRLAEEEKAAASEAEDKGDAEAA